MRNEAILTSLSLLIERQNTAIATSSSPGCVPQLGKQKPRKWEKMSVTNKKFRLCLGTEAVQRHTPDTLKYPFADWDSWFVASLRQISFFSRQCFRSWLGKLTNMMNADNKDTPSLMSLCKMRDSSYHNLLLCTINNTKEYQSSFGIQRRSLERITFLVFTPRCCNPAVQCTVPEMRLSWAVDTGDEN